MQGDFDFPAGQRVHEAEPYDDDDSDPDGWWPLSVDEEDDARIFLYDGRSLTAPLVEFLCNP